MDNTTFGSFKSAQTLATELKNKPKLANKIGNFLQDYTEGLSRIKSISNKKYQRRIVFLWRKDFLDHVKFHSSVDTFVKNVIVAYYRKFLESW